MSLQFTSRYPGIRSVNELRQLWQQEPYQQALAKNGKMTRSSIVNGPTTGETFRSTWECTVHRSLEQPHLQALRVIYPDGMDVRWREHHEYGPYGGKMKIDMLCPVDATIAANATFCQNGNTLERHLDFDMNHVHVRGPLKWVPGLRGKVVHEVAKGLGHADERTQTWLKGEFDTTP